MQNVVSCLIPRIAAVLSVFIGVIHPIAAQFQERQWKAHWITNEFPQDISNSWIDFKTTCQILEPAITSGRFYIAVDSKYWLWINGKMVVREGGLKRGPTPVDTYYDEVDVTPFLLVGTNTIKIQVWYFGKNGFSHNSSGKAGLLAELSVNNKTSLISSTEWLARINPGYQHESQDPQPNFRLAESVVVFDAQKNMDWAPGRYDPRQWHNAYSVGPAGIEPWNRLLKRPIPQWKDFGLSGYKKTPSLPFMASDDTVRCTLKYNSQITPYFKIDAPAGKRVIVMTDDYKGGSEYNLRAEYITTDGVQEYETPAWINGHVVYYIIPKGIKVLDLKYRESGFDTDVAGLFTCNDKFFNTLWQKAARTLYITMRDSYMDCPERERAQWWGDVVNESGEGFYALDTSSISLTRKAMMELVNWQKSDSVLFSPVPAGNWNKELPMQMLASVGYYGFWNYFLHTGDTATLKYVYLAVKKYLSIWKLDQRGMVIGRPGDWTWGDWGSNIDMDLLYNTWFCLAQQGFASMANVLGYSDDQMRSLKIIASLKQNFNDIYWNGKEYRSPWYKSLTDDRGNAMAVLSGLAPPSYYPAICKVLEQQEHASPYMEKYVIESLFMMGREHQALSRLRKRFSPMVLDSLTTLWEGWKLNSSTYGGGTYDHAWSGGGLTLLSQWIGGITPMTPGYDKVQVRPQMGSIETVNCTMMSVKGRISVSTSIKNPGRYMQNISSPKNLTLYVYFPFTPESLKTMIINGKKIPKKKLLATELGAQLILPGGVHRIAAQFRHP